jgi:hypothetical protein
MSNLSLLFAPVTQVLSNASLASRDIELDAFDASVTAKRTGNAARGEPADYLLPSGVESLEHWLDLNA